MSPPLAGAAARPEPSVVALGGGHGLAVSLRALRHVTRRVTAVVTVADDGGSSGRLRQEFGALPPGDLRMALAALCEDSDQGRLWRDVLQHRFTGDGPLGGHALGNLLIVTLWQLREDPVAGLDVVRELLGVQGRVLPMASVPLEIEASVREPTGSEALVRGQAKVATAPGHVRRLRLVPEAPPAHPEAVRAVRDSDWVILGPGSWFTSVLPHVLVPELARALEETRARCCLTLNLQPQVGETSGYRAEQLLEVLAAYAPRLRLDAVVADPGAVADPTALHDVADALGAQLWLRQVSLGDGTARHHPLRLAAAYADVFAGAIADV